MPTLKAPRKTVVDPSKIPAKKAAAKKPAPSINADKIAKAKAAAAAKKNAAKNVAAPKPTAATKTAAAVKKAAAKKVVTTTSRNTGTASKRPASAAKAVAKPARTYKPGATIPATDVIYKRSEIKDWSRDKKEIAAALIHAPKSLYAKMSDADLDELLYGNHPYWDGAASK